MTNNTMQQHCCTLPLLYLPLQQIIPHALLKVMFGGESRETEGRKSERTKEDKEAESEGIESEAGKDDV